MIKIDFHDGVCELEVKGDLKEKAIESVLVARSLYDMLKEPAAQKFFQDMVENFSMDDGFIGAKLKSTKTNKKIANELRKIRKELKNND